MQGMELLEVYIRDSGLKKSYIAEQLCISRQSFSNKLSGTTPFTLAEVKNLVELLDIKTNEDKINIFLT